MDAVDQIIAIDPNNDYAIGIRHFIFEAMVLQFSRNKWAEIWLAAEQEKLRMRIPMARIEDPTVEDVVDFFRDVTEANIFVDWSALENVGVTRQTRVDVRPGGRTLEEAIEQLLRAARPSKGELIYVFDEGVIVITTTTARRRDPAGFGPASPPPATAPATQPTH
jgi:hypothetical protein